MKKISATFLLLGMLAITPVMAMKPACRLAGVNVTYHESTGQTTATYPYECDGPI